MTGRRLTPVNSCKLDVLNDLDCLNNEELVQKSGLPLQASKNSIQLEKARLLKLGRSLTLRVPRPDCSHFRAIFAFFRSLSSRS
jgi:hypothetical protein